MLPVDQALRTQRPSFPCKRESRHWPKGLDPRFRGGDGGANLCAAADGRLTTAEFSDFAPVSTARGTSLWPRQVVLRAFRSGDREVGFIRFEIAQLTVDAELPDDVFYLDRRRASQVWDDDAQSFVAVDR